MGMRLLRTSVGPRAYGGLGTGLALLVVAASTLAMASLVLAAGPASDSANDSAGSGAASDLFFNASNVSPPSCFARVVGGADYASVDVEAIEAALNAAPDGGTIKLAGACAGVRPNGSGDQSVYITRSVALEGGYNPADWDEHDPAQYPTVIDALGLGRVVTVDAFDAEVVLRDLILQGGDDIAGGGIWNFSASLLLAEVVVQGNFASEGGGILSVGSDLTLDHAQVISNTAKGNGGGIVVYGGGLGLNGAERPCAANGPSVPVEAGSLYLVNATQVLTNTAGSEGGGVAIYGVRTVVDASVVQYNSAALGGGIHNEGNEACNSLAASGAALTAEPVGGAQLTVSGGSVVAENEAYYDFGGGDNAPEYVYGSGGGIANYASIAVIFDSTVVSNTALYVGGGVANVRGAMFISNTDVISNAALIYGGGIGSSIGLELTNVHCLPGTPTVDGLYGVAVVGSVVRGNFAIFGGGLANDNTLAIVDSTLVTENFAGSGGGLYNESEYGCAPVAQGATDEFVATMTIQNESVVSHNFANGDFNAPEAASALAPNVPFVFGYGGGVFNGENSLAVDSSTVLANAALDGGGVASLGGRVTISGTEVLSNTAEEGSGGGVFMGEFDDQRAPGSLGCAAAPDSGFWADLVIRGGSDLSHNSADNAGGGVASFGPTVLVDASTLADNRAQLGGGLYYENFPDCLATASPDGDGASVQVRNGSVLTGNRANHHDEDEENGDTASFSSVFHGGGLYATFATVDVVSSTVSANTAMHGGGGLFTLFADVYVQDSVVYSNTAGYGGGAHLAQSYTQVGNSTISSNTADVEFGGGLSLENGGIEAPAGPAGLANAYLLNVTLADNAASGHGENLYLAGAAVVTRNTLVAGSPDNNCFGDGGGVYTDGYNLEDGDTCGFNAGTDQPDTAPQLGPLADNGGPTLTHALLPGSPAIDTGACDLETDQRGQPRPDTDGGDCDIGAYEAQAGFQIWLPLVTFVNPDLVGSFSLSPNKTSFAPGEAVTITVVITNQGTAPTTSGFWVDLSINPKNEPAINLPWYDNCGMSPCRGLAWYVSVSLAPGQSITLTSKPGSYAAGHTVWGGSFPAGATDVYLYVDSWNPSSSFAAVFESDEGNNLSALHGLNVAGANVFAQSSNSPRFPERWVRPVE